MNRNFGISGGSKLSVIIVHSMLSVLVSELKKYDTCEISKIGSHTASDRTSRTSGDIEILRNKKLLESFEIKKRCNYKFPNSFRAEEKKLKNLTLKDILL